MERILVICGGKHQIPLIRKAKSMGIEVVNTNLYENSPAFAYADISEISDVLDKEKNLEYAKKYNVSGIISDQSEISVNTVAFVSQALKLKTITTEIAALFTDKYLMREFCEEKGFTFPLYRKCFSCKDAIEFYNRIGHKMIIKPLDADSSKGVFSINSDNDIKSKFSIAQSFSKHENGVIMEEYIDGVEFTVDALVLSKKVYSLAVSVKKHYSYNENVANELFFSYISPEYDYDKLRELNSAIIAESGMEFGLTHCEYKYKNGQYILIEMAARGGGAYIASKIVPYVSGVDNYKYYINAAMNYDNGEYDREIRKRISENNKKLALLKFFDSPCYDCVITKIQGVSEILKHKNVLHFELNLNVGDIVKRTVDDSSRHGYFIACGEKESDIKEVEDYIFSTLRIEYDKEL